MRRLLSALSAMLLLSQAVPVAAASPAGNSGTVSVALTGVQCGGCLFTVQRLVSRLPGVSDFKASMTPPRVTARLDETLMPAAAFAAAVAEALRKAEPEQVTSAGLLVKVDSASCAPRAKMDQACFTEIPRIIGGIPGVSAVKLDETGKLATVEFSSAARVTRESIAAALGASPLKYGADFTF